MLVDEKANITLKTAGNMLERESLERLLRESGADAVGFVELDRPGLEAQREQLRKFAPWATALAVLSIQIHRPALRTPVRSIASAAFQESAHVLKATLRRAELRLAEAGVRSIAISGFFPFEFGKKGVSPFLLSLKPIAEAAGMGWMGKNRMLLHPRLGASHYLGAIVLDRPVNSYSQPLVESPCLGCNLCVAACPTGAISADGRFAFSSCMTHNYRNKTYAFVEWVHTITDSRNRKDYRRRVSDDETLEWWQSLGYEANTYCDYCVAVCPAGEEAEQFAKRKKEFVEEVVRPLIQSEEQVYVNAGSDAEAHVVRRFPNKTPRRIGSGSRANSVHALMAMLPLVFQRGQAKGLSARYHFRFIGKEQLDATVEIAGQKIAVKPGLQEKADFRVTADSATWLGLLAKERSLLWALLSRKVRFHGSLRWLKAFQRCFPG